MNTGNLFDLYSFGVLLAVIVSLLLSAYAWFGARKEYSRPFSVFQIASFVWCFFYYLRLRGGSAAEQVLFFKLQYCGIVAVPISGFAFARAIARRPLSKLELALLLIVPMVTLFYVWGGGESPFFLSEHKAGPSGLLSNVHGPWFWIHAAYSYLVVIAALAAFARRAREVRGSMRRWLVHIISVLTIPAFANLIYIIFENRIGLLNPMPVVLAFSGISIYAGLRRYNLFDFIPFGKNAVFASLGVPFLSVDMEGCIIGCNAQALSIFSDHGFLEGKPLAELCPVAASLAAKGEAELEGLSAEWETRGRFFQITACRIPSKRGRSMGTIIIFSEVTERVESQKALAEARKRADAANEAKSAFLATMSHELRTPLNAVIGLTELSLGGPLSAEQRDNLETVRMAGRTLLSIINDILDFSKIEAGRMTLESTDFDLPAHFARILKAFRPSMDRKSLSLEFVVEPGAPRFVRGDSLRLGQVFSNLVGNAVKFTEKGGIVVTLAPEKSPVDETLVGIRVSVRDSGIGIPAEKQNLIFEVFSQADPSVSRRFGGTGLGLSISRKLVGLFNGQLTVESIPGEGSVFSFTAFLERGKAAGGYVPLVGLDLSAGLLGEGQPSLSVLVVEDNALSAKVAVRWLEQGGFSAVLASSGSAALRLLSERRFDLLFMDIELPDMDGFEITRSIRAGGVGVDRKTLPIIAMTAHRGKDIAVRCAEAGMDGHVSKPVDFSELSAAIAKAMRLSPRMQHPFEASMVGLPDGGGSIEAKGGKAQYPITSARRSIPVVLIDQTEPLKRLGGDEGLYRELVAIFATEAQGRAAALESAWKARNRATLRRLSHSLLGSALTIGAEPLSAAARRLETICAGGEGLVELGDALTDVLKMIGETANEAFSLLPPGFEMPGLE